MEYIELRLLMELLAVLIFGYMVVKGAKLPFLLLEIRSVLATIVRYLDYSFTQYAYREELLTITVLFTLLPAIVFLYEKITLKKKKIKIIENIQQLIAEKNNR